MKHWNMFALVRLEVTRLMAIFQDNLDKSVPECLHSDFTEARMMDVWWQQEI